MDSLVFFFKQKTAYEMLISDWSSDVCSSDLADRPGFERGRNLDKIGQKAADTSEMFFNDVRVPAGNLLGEPGRGFAIMMEELPRERLTIASRALGESQRAFELTVDYVKEREAFGQRIIDRSEEHTSELQSLMRISYAVFCL